MSKPKPGDWFLTFSSHNVGLRQWTAKGSSLRITGNGVIGDAAFSNADLNRYTPVPITQDQADTCFAFVSLLGAHDDAEALWLTFAHTLKGNQDAQT